MAIITWRTSPRYARAWHGLDWSLWRSNAPFVFIEAGAEATKLARLIVRLCIGVECPPAIPLYDQLPLVAELGFSVRMRVLFNNLGGQLTSDLIETTDATTKADVIRRAVASYSYLKKQQKAHKDAKIVITDDDKIRKEIVLP